MVSVLFAVVLLLLGCSCGSDAADTSALAPKLNFELLLDLLQDQLRQIVLGLPLDLSFSTLNFICSTIVEYGIVQSKIIPDMSQMSFQLHTNGGCSNVSVPLSKAGELWSTSGFEQSKPTVIYITGWKNTINESNAGPLVKAYACRNDWNIVVLDAANFIDTLYTWSALNTEVIGAYVAKALLKLDKTYVTSRVHVVGHSLGAQIAGATGRNYKVLAGGALLTRITGLDPANPCFYDGNELPGVRTGDAKYVDIIHTNPGVLGTPKREGDADFFANGLDTFKPGCTGLDSITCSHQRAVDYWVESVYPSNARNFRGRGCPDYVDLWGGKYCNGTEAIMGYAADPSVLGLFYVEVNSEQPYGKYADPDTNTYTNTTCGLCKSGQ